MKENANVALGLTEKEVKTRLMAVPGPFCSRKRLYNSISSTDRPRPDQVESAMEHLKDEALGSIVRIRRGVIFYKAFPHLVDATSLAKYGISAEKYKETYFSEDRLITDDQKSYMVFNHPQRDAYELLDETTT